MVASQQDLTPLRKNTGLSGGENFYLDNRCRHSVSRVDMPKFQLILFATLLLILRSDAPVPTLKRSCSTGDLSMDASTEGSEQRGADPGFGLNNQAEVK